MTGEICIELRYPDLLVARFHKEQVQVPLPLGIEHNFLFQMLDRLDESEASSRERFMIYLGQQLFESLFPPGALELYLRALAEQRKSPGASLRIRILSSHARLLSLPWEFVYDTRLGLFPAGMPETTIVRTPHAVGEGPALEPLSRLKLLLVGASPSDQAPLKYGQEMAEIAATAGRAGLEVLTLSSVTARRLREVHSEFQPHILHVMCHGFVDELGAGLKLEDRSGGTHLFYGPKLVELLQPSFPRLVILNACDSARFCQETPRGLLPMLLLEAGVPAVVAMQHRIPDLGSRRFGVSFFEALLEGASLERAVQAARHALLVSQGLAQRHFTTPVLYLGLQHGGGCIRSQANPVAMERPAQGLRPFLYLDSFSRDHHTLFFGRTKAIEALVSLIATHRLLVVHGRSGVGKTSLLQAGIAQSGAASLYQAMTLRFFQDPLRSLDEALDRVLQQLEAQVTEPGSIHRGGGAVANSGAKDNKARSRTAQLMVRLQHRTGRTTLLILDQFEEFFVLLDEGARARFLDGLHTLYSDPDLHLRIVLVMREDFFGELDRLRDRFPTILANSYYLSPLSADEARSALEGPLDYLGIPYERSLSDRILSDLWLEGVDPASLQIVAHHVFEHCYGRDGSPLTVEAYLSLGGAAGILARYLQSFLSRFSVTEQQLLERILNCFITNQGTRQPATLSEVALAASSSLAAARAGLRQMESAHLVRCMDVIGEGPEAQQAESARWELSHEVLIVAIQECGLATYKEEVLRLRRRIRIQIVALNIAILLMVTGFWWFKNYGMILTVLAPQSADWSLRLYPGQASCREPNSDASAPAVYELHGSRFELLFPPVGTYEASLVASGRESIFFPVEVRSFGIETVALEPVPDLKNSLPAGMQFVYVTGGERVVGHEVLSRLDASDKLRTVNVAPFFISRTEVTRAQFRAFADAMRDTSPEMNRLLGAHECDDPERKKADGTNETRWSSWEEPTELPGVALASMEFLPVVYVTYHQAEAFTRWLSTQVQGYRFRLPNDEEWEMAARGLDQRMYPWGNCFAAARFANLGEMGTEDDRYAKLAPVGTFPEGGSPYGVLDMSGNAMELVESCVKELDPQGEGGEALLAAERCGMRKFRGGSYRSMRLEAFATRSGEATTDTCSPVLGFRVLMEVKDEEE